VLAPGTSHAACVSAASRVIVAGKLPQHRHCSSSVHAAAAAAL
jgi:hypothetical protein